MKVFKIITGVIVTAATVVAVNTTTAGATGTSNKCDVVGVGLNGAGKNMVEKDGKITATFKVTGKNCTTPVTLAVWKSPVDSVDKIGQNVSNQTLFGHTTNSYGPGTHTITADLPACFYQADLLVGDKATAPDGTPNYAFQNGKILKVHPLRDFKFGGDKKCEEPEEPEDVCPNLGGIQEEVPEGYTHNDDGTCEIVPEDPEEPKTPAVKGEQTPTVLPETGAGAVAATFMGVSTSAGIAHAIVRRFKKW